MLTSEQFWDRIFFIVSIPEAIIGWFLIFRHQIIMERIYYMYSDLEEVERGTELAIRTVGGYIYAVGILCMVIFATCIVRIFLHAILPKKGEYRILEEELR